MSISRPFLVVRCSRLLPSVHVKDEITGLPRPLFICYNVLKYGLHLPIFFFIGRPDLNIRNVAESQERRVIEAEFGSRCGKAKRIA